MEETVADQKVCGICGRDCSTRPRLRDPAGRYTCRECHGKLYGENGRAPKICDVCRRDCSTRPRLRNKGGEYTCRDCFERMRAHVEVAIRRRRRKTKPRKMAPAAAAGAAISETLSVPSPAAIVETKPTPENPRACPGCGAPQKRRAVLCLACGFNKLTGTFTGPIIVGAGRT